MCPFYSPLQRSLQFHEKFPNNRFYSNFLYVKNMMLYNEKPNKNKTLPGFLVFLSYQRCLILNIFI